MNETRGTARRVRIAGTLAAVCGMLAAFGSGSAAPAAPAGSAAAKVKTVTLAMKHRIYANFTDLQTVPLQKEFLVGDSDFSAKVVRYVPDFAMELKTGKVVSRSNQPKNPAFQIIVKEKKVPQDTTWALLNMPPHFGRKSYLAFKVVRIDFMSGPPIVADTTKVTPPQVAAPSAPGAVGTVSSHGGGGK